MSSLSGSSEFIEISVFSVSSSRDFPATSTGCVGVLVGITVGETWTGCRREPNFEQRGFGVESAGGGVSKKLKGFRRH